METMNRSIRNAVLVLFVSFSLNTSVLAAYVQTSWIPDLQISMDNGVTYFRGFTTGGNCQNDRLELRESGDYFGNVENGRRMYAAILAARLAGKAIRLGYNDTDGPDCRVAEVWVDW
jgi:hypothetical protein